MQLSEILDQALNEIGHPKQDSYFSGDDDVILAIAQRSARSLSQEFYSQLRVQGSITMTSALSYSLPSDLRYFVPDTMNAQDIERSIKFPVSNKEWHYLKSQTNQSGIRYKARVMANTLNFETVESGQVILFEYITNNCIYEDTETLDKNAPNLERFNADTNIFTLDDDLFILDIIWRYSKAKNIENWQVEKQIFDDYKKTHKAQESSSGTLDMSGDSSSEYNSPHYPLWQSN